MKRLTILFILLLFTLAACAGDPTPDATEEPVDDATEVVEEATAEAVEATEEMTEEPVEATEEMTEEADMEATEEMEMTEEAMEATEEMEMTEEADAGAMEMTEEAMEATEEMEMTEEAMEATEEMEMTEEAMEATEEMEMTEEAMEATEEMEMTEEAMEATEEMEMTEEAMEATEEMEMTEEAMEATEEMEMTEEAMEATEEMEMTEEAMEATEMEMTEEAEMTPEPTAAPEATEEAVEEASGWVCPEGFEGQQLNVYNWSTYIAEDTIPNFEELCGVTVEYTTYESDEAMLTRIRNGNPGFDIVVPSGDTIAVMAREGLLIPLDMDAIPNFANLNPDLLGAPYDPDNTYSVPYQWGTVGIGYSVEAFPDGISSWEELFAYDGQVAWLDDRRAMFGVALIMLGYDPNTENLDEIEEARLFLEENGGNVVAIAADDGQEMLARGDVDATVEYSGDIFALAEECECDDYAYVIPSEAANLWTDNLAIPIDAPNPELAMVFIDYILDAQVGADISNYTAYASPNQAAIDQGLIDADYLGDPGIYPSEETAGNLFVIEEPSEEIEQAYNDAWDELLIFVGQ